MKTFILLAVSIAILSGCDMSMGSLDLKGDGSNVCSKYYKAIVKIKYENGEPCTTAMAECEAFLVEADSNGVLRIWESYSYVCDDKKDIPVIKSYYFKIYEEHFKNIIWKGDIKLIRHDRFGGEWPDPFIEIVIPDSLAP